MPDGCDIVGCQREASVEVALEGLVRIQPRDTTLDPVPLCATHADAVAAEVNRQVMRVLEPPDPNLNRSNRAMSSEDLGDAES